jgi:hypothetical protein
VLDEADHVLEIDDLVAVHVGKARAAPRAITEATRMIKSGNTQRQRLAAERLEAIMRAPPGGGVDYARDKTLKTLLAYSSIRVRSSD